MHLFRGRECLNFLQLQYGTQFCGDSLGLSIFRQVLDWVMKAISNQLARIWHIKPQDQTEGFDSWDLFGLTPLSGGGRGYMPPLLKTRLLGPSAERFSNYVPV